MPGSKISAKNRVGVIGVPIYKGQSHPGTETAPEMLRKAGLLEKIKNSGYEITDYGDLSLESVSKDESYKNAKNPRSVGAAAKKVAEAVSQSLKTKDICLVLGGDHSLAIGSIFGHVQADPDVIVVWIDAHADINTPLTSISGNIHGMPLAFLVKEVEPYTPKIPMLEWCRPCLSAKDIVYIGLRDIDQGERKIIDQFGIPAYSMHDVDKYGIQKVLERALREVDASGCRPIHVSFDVDALDPMFTPATGTPVPGGLSLREGLYIAEELASTGRVTAIDLVELNPQLSNEENRKLTIDNTLEVMAAFFGRRREGSSPAGYSLPFP